MQAVLNLTIDDSVFILLGSFLKILASKSLFLGNSASEESPNTVKISGDTMKIGWRSVEYAISYRVHVKPLNGNSTFFDVKKNSTELTSLKPSTYYVIDVQPIFSWGMGPRFVKNLKVKTPSMCFAFLPFAECR